MCLAYCQNINHERPTSELAAAKLGYKWGHVLLFGDLFVEGMARRGQILLTHHRRDVPLVLMFTIVDLESKLSVSRHRRL